MIIFQCLYNVAKLGLVMLFDNNLIFKKYLSSAKSPYIMVKSIVKLSFAERQNILPVHILLVSLMKRIAKRRNYKKSKINQLIQQLQLASFLK
jgi:hypothetical protein